eukprot:TRINITY_DN6392_c0_g1_i1.p1 TRINITY_DN6392_c0_g1~~TRINITY_DN6392_c0_g1_i1.p1  ORF type:complete len:401 (+),score=53.84 TRINITY_DN6392_c0_g1_i1:167-1204(+)
MMVLLRVWGMTAPNYVYFSVQFWAVGFAPFFIVALIIVKLRGSKFVALDGIRPIFTQSLLISALLSFNYLGVSAANPHVSGPVQVILAQIPIAFSLGFAYIVLRRVYSWQCWVGAVLVIIGTLVSLVGPMLTDKNSASTSSPVGWSIVYLVGMIPMGILPIFYEGFHKARGSDGQTMTLEWRLIWTTLMLSVWLWIELPIFFALGEPTYQEFAPNMRESFLCIIMRHGGENCDIALPILIALTIVASAQMHSQVILSKGATGAFGVLVLTISPFLADVVYPIKPLMGPYYIVPSLWDLLAALVCIAGVLLFAWFDHKFSYKYPAVESSRLVQWFLREGNTKPTHY